MIRRTAPVFAVATFTPLTAACNDDSTVAPVTSSHTASTSTSVTPPDSDNAGTDCEGTICTNPSPNRGAGE